MKFILLIICNWKTQYSIDFTCFICVKRNIIMSKTMKNKWTHFEELSKQGKNLFPRDD